MDEQIQKSNRKKRRLNQLFVGSIAMASLRIGLQ